MCVCVCVYVGFVCALQSAIVVAGEKGPLGIGPAKIHQSLFLAQLKQKYPNYWEVLPNMLARTDMSLFLLWKHRLRLHWLLDQHQEFWKSFAPAGTASAASATDLPVD